MSGFYNWIGMGGEKRERANDGNADGRVNVVITPLENRIYIMSLDRSTQKNSMSMRQNAISHSAPKTPPRYL